MKSGQLIINTFNYVFNINYNIVVTGR